VTVFLTTQYLEEADVLADRVGIIDRGHIVAEGTPEELKDEIGRPSVEAIPQDPEQLGRTKQVLARFGEAVTGSPKGASVRLDGGDAQLAEVVRALDAENIDIQELQLHAPTLDDVFLAKTGRSLEGEAEPEAAVA
jgi:ABC-2 type transport system ATP-binding protein